MGIKYSISLLFALATMNLAAELQVVYPSPQSSSDTRFNDLIEILTTALEKTEASHGPFTLQPSEFVMREGRQLTELSAGRRLNVVWSSTSHDKERELLPIRIPLRKGILGYRVALIHKDNQSKIDQIKTLNDLRLSRLGQGTGWGDVHIYEHNGIPVTTTSYDALFKMVDANRLDLFPRGINEVFAEHAIRHDDNPNLVVEKNLLIYYPWPYYFFFNKDNEVLKERIESGIRTMIADGSFDEIFWRFNGNFIQQANTTQRRVITIENHLMPELTPVKDQQLWFDPLEPK